MVSILLNSSAFLPFDAESTAFWVLLAIMAGSLFISYMDEENPMRSLLLNLLCAGATFLFSGLRGELFWFLNIEKVGLLLWVFCYILTFMFFGVIAGHVIAFIRWFFDIFENPTFGVIGLILSVIWGSLLWRLVPIFFEEHQIVFFLTLMGAAGMINKAMDGPQVSSTTEPEPEPGPSPNPSPGPGTGSGTGSGSGSGTDDPYFPQGIPCCDNCRWNQNRGSYSVRCFQNSSRVKEPNDKCDQWNRC